MPNFGRRGSRQSIEPKAVLEHRAPKTSPPILHSRSAESKAGRAVHCAPELLVLTRLPGWNPAVRALTGAATARATLQGRSKSRVFEGKAFIQTGCCVRSGYAKLWTTRKSCQSIEPKAVLEHRAPKTSTPILHTRGVESMAGRAVRCAPVWVVLTRLLGWNPGVRALTGAATARATLWVVKSACHALPTLTALRPRWPRAKSAQRRSESAGRAVRCAPEWVVATRLLGWNPGVRALTGAATARAPLQGRSKSRVFEGKALSKPAAVCARAVPNFGRRGSRQSIEPKAVLEHRAPKTSPPILHSRGVESKAGRAVDCAPV